jgi:hypothetical protein
MYALILVAVIAGDNTVANGGVAAPSLLTIGIYKDKSTCQTAAGTAIVARPSAHTTTIMNYEYLCILSDKK